VPALSVLARRHPEREAVVVDDPPLRVTYGELDAAANRLAHLLRRQGLQPGDALAVALNNGIGVFWAYWACMVLGVDHVPVNPRLRRAELAHLLADSGATAVITGPEAAGEVVAAADQTGVRVRFGLGTGEDLPDLEAAMADQSTTVPEDAWEGGLLFYSSGTTGRPKGVVRDFPRVRPGGEPTLGTDLAKGFGLRGGDRYLCPGPLYHSAPLTWSTAQHRVGATTVVMRRFDARRALELLDREAITTSQWVPTMFGRLLALDPAERGGRRPAHRLAVHAAAPCPVALKQQMLDWWGPIITEYYSGTEGGRTMIDAASWRAHPGSVGRHWKGGRTWILDDAGRELPPGTDGLVYFDAPAVGRFHYRNLPDATRAAYQGDRFTLGEVGHLDEHGFLYLTGRASDVIISGGVNLYPAETDEVLHEHPALDDAACYALPDPDLGEIMVAAVVPAGGAGVTGEVVLDWLESRLAVHKLPRRVQVVDRIPRSEAGKVLRRELTSSHTGRDAGQGPVVR
jgi:long-chain acyl-CoA synthetase